MKKSLGRIAILVVLGVLAFLTMPFWPGQMKNLHAIEQWLHRVQPEIDRFKAEEKIEFRIWAFTRSQGVVGVRVDHPHTEKRHELKRFLESLAPPRPIDWSLQLGPGSSSYSSFEHYDKNVEEIAAKSKVSPIP